MKPAPKFVLPGKAKRKLGRNPPQDVLIMDNLEISLVTTVYKSHGNTSGSMGERLIKPRV